jgi:alpha-galactosidase
MEGDHPSYGFEKLENPPGVRYYSAGVIYLEELLNGRWAGRYWTADARPSTLDDRWDVNSFRLEIGGVPVCGGWNYEGSSDSQGNRQGTHRYSTELSNEEQALRVEVNTLLDGSPVITRWLRITNESNTSLALTSVFPWTGSIWARRAYAEYPPEGITTPFVLGRFTRSDWSYEGWFEWENLKGGKTAYSCDKGQGFDGPFFVLHNVAKGEYVIGQLAWPANWLMEFDLVEDTERNQDSLIFGIGPWSSHALRVISPGESVTTPAVHLSLVSGSLDSAIQGMHQHVRKTVVPQGNPDRLHLVQYSVPADQGYPRGIPRGFNEDTLIRNVDLAEALGAEMFIIDAGWWDVAGNWWPSQERFPKGLEPVIIRAREKGMLFGLYAEIEGGRGNWEESRIFGEHPDWFGPKNVIDLTKPGAADYVEREVANLVETHGLDLFRLDYNPLFTFEGAVTDRDDYVESNYWRHYDALFDLYERIQKRFPNLILQQAAAGGARNDLGIAGRFHENYLTDGLRVPHVLQVFSGLSMSLPPETFVIGLGADGGVARGHPMNMETNLRTIFSLSTPWIFAGMTAPSLGEMAPESLEGFRRYVKIYREFIRPKLPECLVYHHAPVSSTSGVGDSPWFAMEFGSPDREKGWATIVRMGPSESDEYRFKPRGLRRGGEYEVTFDSTRETARVDGLRLTQDGISLRLEEVCSSELLLFEKV